VVKYAINKPGPSPSIFCKDGPTVIKYTTQKNYSEIYCLGLYRFLDICFHFFKVQRKAVVSQLATFQPYFY
jgi:hypothetical protein